ncbi:MAG: response regulator transcription factor [Chitinophagaceae bacterium]|nr:response regulator transcription factor [Chitinophagaceae bacterium]
MDEIQILIVEDEPVIAENIAYYLNNHDFKVCGIAYDSDEAKMFLENGSPDAIVLDINLQSEMDGLDIAAYVNANYRIPFILLTSYADKETIEKAKKVKPWGYIVKPFNEDTLLASLEMAISNFAQTQNRDQPEPRFEKINKHLISQVTEREFEVLKLIYAGKTNQQIAEALFVSVNTVKKHINSSYLKLDVLTRTSAIARLRELMMK